MSNRLEPPHALFLGRDIEEVYGHDGVPKAYSAWGFSPPFSLLILLILFTLFTIVRYPPPYVSIRLEW